MTLKKRPSGKDYRRNRPRDLLRLDPEIQRLLVMCLEYYEGVFTKSITRMSSIPRKERPKWYENSITYHKHAQRALRWVKRMVAAIGNPNGTTRQHSPETPDSVLPIGSDAAVNRHRRELRDWFESL